MDKLDNFDLEAELNTRIEYAKTLVCIISQSLADGDSDEDSTLSFLLKDQIMELENLVRLAVSRLA